MYRTSTILSSAVLALSMLVGCKQNASVDTNVTPVANAGEDQELDYSGSPVDVTLDGSGSNDPDGRIVEYLWLSDDRTAAEDPENVVQPEFPLDEGWYSFTLWVRDDRGQTSAPDSVVVAVGGPLDQGPPMPDGGGAGDPDEDGGTAGAAPAVTCDDSIATTASCGGMDCPEPTATAAAVCAVPCCVGDACGMRSAIMGATTECSVAPVEDPACPDYDNGMVMLQGCCFDGSTCGFISTVTSTCIVESMFLADLAEMAGAPCGG